MSRDIALITSLYEIFTDRSIEDCLDANDAVQLVVYEDIDGRACIEILDDKDYAIGFHIQNSGEKSIYLFALDHCFFESHDGPRCDCILFDDRYFCFVELKLNVERHRRVTRELRRAREQLGATIRFFKAAIQPKSKSFFNFILEAYVVMETVVYPRKRASRDTVFVRFLEDFGVELYEKDSKSF